MKTRDQGKPRDLPVRLAVQTRKHSSHSFVMYEHSPGENSSFPSISRGLLASMAARTLREVSKDGARDNGGRDSNFFKAY
jgi:hypothetical protein